MGVGFAVAVAVISIAVAAATLIYALTQTPGGAGDAMDPASMDDFQFTQAKEGSAIPLVFGKVKLNSNLLWYGNLTSVYRQQIVKGSDNNIPLGYEYYMDIWHCLCEGPDVTLHSIYKQDDPLPLTELGSYTLNDGDDAYFPTAPGPYASRLKPLAHLYQTQYNLGLNATTIPTFHFVISRESNAPLSNINMTNGVNAAGIIYELLIRGGALQTDINLSSFQEAADYWYSKGYGLNIAMRRQQTVRQWVNTVFNYVDGCLRLDENDQFILKAYRDTDTSSATMDQDDFLEFTFSRPTWHELPNDFRATLTDEDQDFTDRTIRARNPAVQAIVGREKQRTIDLKAFRDTDTASKRLWEIMKQASYPAAQIECKTNLTFMGVNVGDVVTVSHDDYGLVSAEFRVIEKNLEGIDKNEVGFALRQRVDAIIDSNWVGGGDSDWVSPDYSPDQLAYSKIFELPYNPITEEYPMYLILGQREGIEDELYVYYSTDDSDYQLHSVLSTYAQRGTLGAAYTTSTDLVDDDVGILYTPYREDPGFSTVPRARLYEGYQFALIDDEIIGFQTVTAEGASSFRLTGCLRGCFGTTVATHSSGAVIWLFQFGNNVVQVTAGSFYLKLVPASNGQEYPIASVSSTAVTYTAKSKTPFPPMRILVAKSGSTNTVTCWPTHVGAGAGLTDPDSQTDEGPPWYNFDGTWEWYTSLDGTVNTETDGQWVVSQSGGFQFYVRHTRHGFSSPYVSVTVGASDDDYVGPNY